jgi:glycosyltransferase involved in cell wall biosynthesis
LTSDKGVHILFDAFEKLYALRNNFHLIVAGDGDYMKQAKGRVASSDWGGNVKLLGHQDNIANLHAVSDFFIMPTLHENLSNALLEAMHESKAIITTSVGGNSEVVVDEATGLLIPPSDVEALVKSVIRLIDNPPECNQFGLNGRKRVIEHFAFDAFIDNIDSVYRKLLG